MPDDVFTRSLAKSVNGKKIKTNFTNELVRVYEKKVLTEMSGVFHQDESFDPLNYFKGKLAELQSQIYLDVDVKQSISKSCCNSIMEYCKEQHSIIDRQAKENFSQFWAGIIKKWVDDEFVKQWLTQAGVKLETLQHSPTVTQLNTDAFTQLKNVVLKWYKGKRKFTENEQDKIREIAGILSISLIDPIWAEDMKVSSNHGARLRITFNNNLPMLADNEYLSCHLVTYAALRKPPRLIRQGSSVVAKDVLQLKPVPLAREQKEIDLLLSEILSRVLPESANDIRATLHERKYDWPNKFIGRINSNYESMLNDDRFFSRASLFIGDNGKSITNQHLHWDDVVTELLDYLNKDVDAEKQVKLSITIAGERDDGNLVQLITDKSDEIHSIMYIIADLLELCDE